MTDAAPMVDASETIRMVGGPSFERGRTYARSGAVTFLAWDAGDDVLTGVVLGSGAEPYRTRVELVPARGELWKPRVSSCTCPMLYNCKHVAATILFSNAETLREHAAPVASAEPAWKKVLGAFAPAGSGLAATTTPMGLLFEVREQVRRSRSQWNAPVAKAASAPLDPEATYRLGVRPVLLSPTRNWVRGNLTWGSIGYQANRLDLRTDQLRWFAQFSALHRATRDTYVAAEQDWLYLDDFFSPLLWRLLGDADGLGIVLVSGKRETDVAVGSVARLSIDVRGSGAVAAPDLRLEPVIEIDGATTAAASAGLIGNHGAYTFALDPGPRFSLAPTEAAITDEQRALFESRRDIVVPAADAGEFLRDYYPVLHDVIAVTSTDASVQFPEILPPVLVLTIAFEPGQRLRLTLAWEGGTGATPRELVGLPASLEGLAAAEFMTRRLPAIEQLDGVRVDLVGDRPDYRELVGEPSLTITTVETDKRDWFDLGVLVTVDGHTVPFTPLFTALTIGAKKLLLIDNSYLSLEHPAFDELKRLIADADELVEWETGPRISRYQASYWAELEELADFTEQAVSWREAVGGLNDLDNVESTPLPAGLDADLRPYQRDGFDWLAFLHRYRLGGVLADDMGLGKTLQTITLIAHAVGTSTRSTASGTADSGSPASRGPFLVVAPTSVVGNWLAEFARFAPGLRVQGLTKSRTALATDVEVIVTSYALFRLNFDAYQKMEWAGLVLDEAQFVKNPGSKAHQRAVELRAPFKLALTGTPMENSLMDLWSLFHIVSPGLFPSSTRFTEQYVKPITMGTRPELLAQLRRRIRPLMMRRTKELVASELPAKQEQVLQLELSPRHRKLYDTFLQKERQKLLGLIDDLDKNRFIVFRSLTLLRMLALDASLVAPEHSDIPSSKLDALFEQLEDVIAEGHRALVFSQFTTFLGLARARLEAAGIEYEYLDGSTLRRPEVIERFKNGTAPVFLISLKAGGFGLNLTEADYVFLLDPWWNPATESQAVDRTHRIGQTKSVMVYRLVAKDTIEEKVMQLKEQKAALFDAVMDDDAVFSSKLTADDIRSLLE